MARWRQTTRGISVPVLARRPDPAAARTLTMEVGITFSARVASTNEQVSTALRDVPRSDSGGR